VDFFSTLLELVPAAQRPTHPPLNAGLILLVAFLSFTG
jgi:hypothetical protein